MAASAGHRLRAGEHPMAIPVQSPVNTSVASAGATVFPFAFKVFSQDDLQVTVDGSTKYPDTDFTVSGVGVDGGGSITFLTPLAAGQTVERKRYMPIKRDTDYQGLGDLRAGTLNTDFDSLVMMMQGLEFTSIFNEYTLLTEEGAVILPDWWNPDSGSVAYADLTGKPTLGTAAAQDSTAFDTSGAADAAEVAAKAYADSLVVSLGSDRGTYDASGNVFPTTGGSGTAGAIKSGDRWTISVAGTLGGTAVSPGDILRALMDAPASSSDWSITYFATAEPAQTPVSGVEALDGTETAIRSWSPFRIFQAIGGKLTLGTWISGATSKTTPVDGDSFAMSDSAGSNAVKRLTWANLKATLKAYFDTLYAVLADFASSSAGKGTDLVGVYDQVSTAYLKVTSDIINGERVSVLRGITKSKHAGIYAGSNTDNLATDINALLQAMKSAKRGELYFPGGVSTTYNSGQILVPGNMKVIGASGVTINAHSSLASSLTLLQNETISGSVGDRVNTNIILEDLIFKGSNSALRTQALVSFIKAERITLRNCRALSNRYMGMSFGGCVNLRIINPEVSDFGKTVVNSGDPEGGPALWIAAYNDGTVTTDVWVENPYLHDGEWAGIYFGAAARTSIINPSIVNCKEAGIFGTAGGINIEGGHISAITKKYISGAGIEIGGSDVSIIGTAFSEIANSAVSMTDVQGALLLGLRSKNVKRDAASFPTAAHFVLLSQTSSPSMPRDITITGCTAIDYSSPATAAVRVEGSTGSAMTNVSIIDNNFEGTAWTNTAGQAVYIDPTFWTSANCKHANNSGADDTVRVTRAYLSSAQSIATTTDTAISFAAASPNNKGAGGAAMWVIGSPTRITIPKDARRVEVTAAVSFAGTATGVRRLKIQKNGVGTYGQIVPSAGAAYNTDIAFAGGVFDVANGDYFTLVVYQDSGGAINANAGSDATWLSVRVLE